MSQADVHYALLIAVLPNHLIEMRTFEDIEQRWTQLFSTSIGVDLRQAIRDDNGYDPCEEGLRSVCWRAFLLYGPLSTKSWTKKLAESRSAYVSLRDHFLKYINNPNDLHSSTDPLADDDTSPWSTLRQDELSREEIFQDVTRCMQENYFFREPVTQRRLLDILFIYSKLNPDTGYRQGMHELLAPVLWVIDQDAINVTTVTKAAKSKEGADFMLEVLDRKYAEHDAFSLFCAIMQTAKSFYELGENKDSSSIVAQSNKIHDELLTAVDPELARHLQVIGVLPQIYSIRWIRLLFGREFDFKDVLKIWDVLFAENLTTEIVNMTCVAILLRVHWQLIENDYTAAITLLTRFKLPSSKEGPRSLVKDASFLSKNKTVDGGASVIQYYSGQRPKAVPIDEEQTYNPLRPQQRQHAKRWNHARNSPMMSPARQNTPQKQLENLLSEVSGTLQRRTEGWSVSKAVRGAVGEVRRNVNNFSAAHSREVSFDHNNRSMGESRQLLDDRTITDKKRNQALAKMLDDALASLRLCKSVGEESSTGDLDAFNAALAKIQFVSASLADNDIPIPVDNEDISDASESTQNELVTVDTPQLQIPAPEPIAKTKPPRDVESELRTTSDTVEPEPASSSSRKHQTRPSLADSSFSFMLGESRQRSSFVSSVTDLPEQRRDSDPKIKTKKLWEEGNEKQERKETQNDDDGFTMSPLR